MVLHFDCRSKIWGSIPPYPLGINMTQNSSNLKASEGSVNGGNGLPTLISKFNNKNVYVFKIKRELSELRYIT